MYYGIVNSEFANIFPCDPTKYSKMLPNALLSYTLRPIEHFSLPCHGDLHEPKDLNAASSPLITFASFSSHKLS